MYVILSVPVYQYIGVLSKFFRLCLHAIVHFGCHDGSSGTCHDKWNVRTLVFELYNFLSVKLWVHVNIDNVMSPLIILVLSVFSIFYKSPSPPCSLQKINFIWGNWWNMYIFFQNEEPSSLLPEKGETNIKIEKTRMNINALYCLVPVPTQGLCHTLYAHCSGPIETPLPVS